VAHTTHQRSTRSLPMLESGNLGVMGGGDSLVAASGTPGPPIGESFGMRISCLREGGGSWRGSSRRWSQAE
jgi:hypothetical protein